MKAKILKRIIKLESDIDDCLELLKRKDLNSEQVLELKTTLSCNKSELKFLESLIRE